MKKLIVVQALACLTIASAAFAQSPLAEAARREAARREALKAGAKSSFTNDDLAKMPQRSAPTKVATPPAAPATIGPAGTDGTPPAAAADQTEQAPAAGGVKDEKYWRERITDARGKLSRAEMFAEALQSRINALSADVVNRDDPAQRQQLAEERQRSLDELAKVRGEIDGFKKEIAGIEDEARRLGVPPGWLR